MLLTLRGEIDLTVQEELRALLGPAVTGMVEAGGDSDIEVCLRAVTYLDCSAIGAIVAGRNAANQAGGVLFVSHPTGIVRQVLELTGVLGDLVFGAPAPAGQVCGLDLAPCRQQTQAGRCGARAACTVFGRGVGSTVTSR